MNKKIDCYMILSMVIFCILHSGFDIHGMFTAKLPPVIAKKFEEPSASVLKKILEAKIEKAKAQLKPKGELYLYDDKTGDGAIFSQDLVARSTTWKHMFEDMDDKTSFVVSTEYSADIIKMGHDVLGICHGLSKIKDNEKECSALVEKKIESLDFNTLASLMSLAHHYDFDKEILTSIIRRVQEKMNPFFEGNEELINQYCPALNTFDRDFLQKIVGDKWYILLEKVKFFIAKNSKDEESKKYFFVENWPNASLTDKVLPYYSSRIHDLLFSPNGKRLLIMGQGSDIVNFPMSIVNSDGTELKLLDSTSNRFKDTADISPVWIDNSTLAYFNSDFPTRNLKLYNDVQGFSEVPLQDLLLPDQVSVLDMRLIEDKKMIFFYVPWDRILNSGIGIFDPTEKNITYQSIPERLLATIIFNPNQNKFFFLSRSRFNNYENYTSILYSLENEKLIELKKIEQTSHIRAVSFNGDKIGMAIENNKVLIYFLDSDSAITYTANNKVLSLKFSSDGKMLLVGCENEVIILSAITGEIIENLTSREGQAFGSNKAIDITAHHNILALGSSCSLTDDMCFWRGKKNIMIWKLIPDDYAKVFNNLHKIKPSINQIALLVLLYARAKKGEKSLILTDDQKNVFHELDKDVQGMLTSIGYIAPGQIAKDIKQKSTLAESNQDTAKPSDSSESPFQRMMHTTGIGVRDFWNYLNKKLNALPGSG